MTEIDSIRNPNGEVNELFTQYVQLDSNHSELVSADGEHPQNVELLATISPPITDIHDVCIASMFYSNEHHRITKHNNVLRLEVVLTSGERYSLELVVPPGTYTASDMESMLSAIVKSGPTRWEASDPTSTPLQADFADPPFQLVSHDIVFEVGRTVTRIKLPGGATLSVPSIQNSLAPLLGFVGSPKVVGTSDQAEVALVSPKMHNLTYSQNAFHLSSNALGQIFEYPPSANNVRKENIVFSHHTAVEAMTPIVVDALRSNETRFRTKANSELSKIDIQLLDQNFEPVENSQIGDFSVVLLIRRTKKLVL